jgi:hypothetical protein
MFELQPSAAIARTSSLADLIDPTRTARVSHGFPRRVESRGQGPIREI